MKIAMSVLLDGQKDILICDLAVDSGFPISITFDGCLKECGLHINYEIFSRLINDMLANYHKGYNSCVYLETGERIDVSFENMRVLCSAFLSNIRRLINPDTVDMIYAMNRLCET